MKTRTIILAISILMFFAQACGTIIHGSTQQVAISSNPSNATVTINGQNYGDTPMIIDLQRKDSHFIKIQLDGYLAYETNLTRSVSGWVWGNIVFGGLIGLVVDASTGGMYKLTPEQIDAELRSPRTEVLSTQKGLFIAIVLEADSSWQKIGSLEPKN